MCVCVVIITIVAWKLHLLPCDCAPPGPQWIQSSLASSPPRTLPTNHPVGAGPPSAHPTTAAEGAKGRPSSPPSSVRCGGASNKHGLCRNHLHVNDALKKRVLLLSNVTTHTVRDGECVCTRGGSRASTKKNKNWRPSRSRPALEAWCTPAAEKATPTLCACGRVLCAPCGWVPLRLHARVAPVFAPKQPPCAPSSSQNKRNAGARRAPRDTCVLCVPCVSLSVCARVGVRAVCVCTRKPARLPKDEHRRGGPLTPLPLPPHSPRSARVPRLWGGVTQRWVALVRAEASRQRRARPAHLCAHPRPLLLPQTHGACRRCGKVTYHLQHLECASCGYPAAKMRRCE